MSLYRYSPSSVKIRRASSTRSAPGPAPGTSRVGSRNALQRAGTSLPIRFGSDVPPPKFKQPSIDELFWALYKPGADIHEYVKLQIKRFRLEMEPLPSTRGLLCKADKRALKLFPYQTIATVLASPLSPMKRLLVIASTGTGKSCILVGIANSHLSRKMRKHGIVFVGATDALYTNFIKQAMECPGYLKGFAGDQGWTDPGNSDHVHSFAKYMRKYIYPLDYTTFGNMISGKYAKYEDFDGLRGKLVLMDEAHYLVDSIDVNTYMPLFKRAPPSWQANLRSMYAFMTTPNNPELKGTILVGATATPVTQSAMEFFALVNLFAHEPLPRTKLVSVMKTVNSIENGSVQPPKEAMKKLKECFDTFRPIVRDTVTMYMAKTSKRVLDTSIFPTMQFSTVHVPLTDEQSRLIYTPKNHIMTSLVE